MYVGADPINLVDPSGLKPYSECETEQVLRKIAKHDFLNAIGAAKEHSNGGNYDYKSRLTGDTFVVDGHVLRQDQFGKHGAGYRGMYAAGPGGVVA